MAAKWPASIVSPWQPDPTRDETGSEPDPVLTREAQLSAATSRLRSWFHLPVAMLPTPRPGRRSELREFVLDVNDLIGGRSCYRSPETVEI